MSQNTKPPINNAVSAVINWWVTLYPDATSNLRGDAGARASIRRAASPFDVMLQPATHEMYKKVRDKTGGDLSSATLRRLALAAAVLCELRTTDQSSTAFTRALGANSSDEPARLSPLRFQSLMAAMDREEDGDALTALRRAIAMLKDTQINVRGLVRDLLSYNDETRICWTYAYFNTPRASDEDMSAATPSPVSTLEEPVS